MKNKLYVYNIDCIYNNDFYYIRNKKIKIYERVNKIILDKIIKLWFKE